MSMTIELSAETETAIKKLAAQNGCQPEEYAQDLITEQVEIKLAQTVVEDPEVLNRALERMKTRSPAKIAAVREKMFRFAKPPRQLPKEQSIIDAVYGKISSDETDEEVFASLQKLS